MFMLAIILFVLGSAIFTMSGIWLYIQAFKAGLLWGLAAFFFFPIGTGIWLVTHLEDGLKPLLGCLLGMGMAYYGYYNQSLWRF